MRAFRWRALLGCFAFVADMVASAADRPHEPLVALDEKWGHYRSPNFELYSSGSEKESRALLWNLELLRAVFFDRFKVTERSRLEVTVYHFRKPEHFAAYGPPGMGRGSRMRGFYLARPDRAVISLGPTDSPEDARHMVFHEYVHHLFRITDQQPAVWFAEGVAELLATIKIAKGKLEIGHARRGNLFQLQSQKLLPLETLFAVDHRHPIYRGHQQQTMFYSQSWALLHYLHFGETKLPREGVDRFVRVMGDAKAARAADVPALFRECLGMDYEEMQRRLDRYVVNGRYHYGIQPVPAIAADTTYAVRSVPRDELRLRLAELALRSNRSPAAKLALLEAVAANTRDPRVYEVLGTEAGAEKDLIGVRERWEQALAAGSENVAVVRELGLLESRQWFEKFDYHFRLPDETAARLRERLRRSIDQVPAQSAAYEMLAWVEAFSTTPLIENVNLVQQHFRHLKEKQRTLLALALVRVRLNRPGEAKTLLGELEQLPPDATVARIAEAVRGRLEAATPAGAPTGR